MNVKSKLRKSPILLLLSVVLIAGSVTAALVYLWSSTAVTHSMEFVIEGEMLGGLIQVPALADDMDDNYDSLIVATTLGTSYNGETPYVSDALMVVYVEGNADLSAGLSVNIEAPLTGPSAADFVVNVTGAYYHMSDDGVRKTLDRPIGPLVIGENIIPYADVPFLTFEPGVVLGDSTLGNCLILEFDFEYIGSTEFCGTFQADTSIVIELGADIAV